MNGRVFFFYSMAMALNCYQRYIFNAVRWDPITMRAIFSKYETNLSKHGISWENQHPIPVIVFGFLLRSYVDSTSSWGLSGRHIISIWLWIAGKQNGFHVMQFYKIKMWPLPFHHHALADLGALNKSSIENLRYQFFHSSATECLILVLQLHGGGGFQ